MAVGSTVKLLRNNAATGSYSEASTWSLDNFGEDLVAVPSWSGNLYVWDLNPFGTLLYVSGSPNNLGLVVTEERFLFALGARYYLEGCLVYKEDLTTWTLPATNEGWRYNTSNKRSNYAGIRTRGNAYYYRHRCT